MPSAASARPPESVRPAGSLAFVATCRTAILSVPPRLRVAGRGHNTERREAHARPRGLRAPATPAPPFFGSPKKGGKESSPLAMSPGLLPATHYALPAQKPAHGRRGSRAHRPTPKSPAPHMHPPGAKTPHRPPHKKRTTTRTVSTWLKCSSSIHFTPTRHAAALRAPRNG